MIAMHYNIVLPRDYDMAIIDRRIADKSHLTDGYPGLLFKAYLVGRGDGRGVPNAYAPFYVWRNGDGMNGFLDGPGFAALSQSFGRPSVALWSVWEALLSPGCRAARFATLERRPIAPGADLAALRASEAARAQHDMHAGALGAVAAFEPVGWTSVSLRLWRHAPDPQADGGLLYEVGHLSASMA